VHRCFRLRDNIQVPVIARVLSHSWGNQHLSLALRLWTKKWRGLTFSWWKGDDESTTGCSWGRNSTIFRIFNREGLLLNNNTLSKRGLSIVTWRQRNKSSPIMRFSSVQLSVHSERYRSSWNFQQRAQLWRNDKELSISDEREAFCEREGEC